MIAGPFDASAAAPAPAPAQGAVQGLPLDGSGSGDSDGGTTAASRRLRQQGEAPAGEEGVDLSLSPPDMPVSPSVCIDLCGSGLLSAAPLSLWGGLAVCVPSSGQARANWIAQRGTNMHTHPCLALRPPGWLPCSTAPTRPAQPGMVDGVVVADGLMWALLLSRTEVSSGLWALTSCRFEIDRDTEH